MMRILVVMVFLAGCATKPAEVGLRWVGQGEKPPRAVAEQAFRECGYEAERHTAAMPASGNTVASVLLDAGAQQRALDRVFDACMGARGFQVVRG